MTLNTGDTLIVGEDTFIESISPVNTYGVVFEDNEETGYFYAVDTKEELVVLDGLHIYNSADVTDKTTPSLIQIGWSKNGILAFLVINQYCHAVFDFEKNVGYCRNGFPENNNGWAKNKDRTLTDLLLEEILSIENK